MIGGLKFLAFVTLLLLGAAHGDVLNANDAQSCVELCASCEGTATFEDGRCECIVPEGNKVAAECVKRLKRDTTNLDLVASSPGLGTSERSARCSLLGSRRRLASGSSLLGRSNIDCSPSSNYGLTGSSNPKSSPPVEPAKEAKVSSPPGHSPVVGASGPSNCATGEYEPIVGTQWLPNYGMGPRMLGAHQPIQGAYYDPHDPLGAVSHWLLAIPNAPLRATHIPAAHHNPGLLASSQHSPLLSSLASGTHGVLQRLDSMIAPYATEHNRGNIVSSAHATETACGHSHEPSHSNSRLVGAPWVAAHGPNSRVLQQVLAHQNSLLEALSGQLANYSPHVASPPMSPLQYTPVPYMLGAAAPMSQCYCPMNGGPSPLVGAANPNESTNSEKSSKPSLDEHVEAVKAANNHSSDESNEDKNEPRKDEKKFDDDKKIVGAKEPAAKNENAEVKNEEKNKSESDNSHSSARKKRGNLKYLSKKSIASAS